MVDKNHCVVCSKEFGFMASGYGGECRICKARCCTEHWDKKEQLCPYCLDKTGKRK